MREALLSKSDLINKAAIVLNDGGAKQQEIVKLLLEHGANPHMTDKYGKSPLTLAREKGYHEIAELLVAAGA